MSDLTAAQRATLERLAARPMTADEREDALKVVADASPWEPDSIWGVAYRALTSLRAAEERAEAAERDRDALAKEAGRALVLASLDTLAGEDAAEEPTHALPRQMLDLVRDRDHFRARAAAAEAERDALRAADRKVWPDLLDQATARAEAAESRAARDREALWEAEAALRAIEPLLVELSEPSEGYGAFPGGDPRDFRPDPECSTEGEREAHRRACALWDAEAQAFNGSPAHRWEQCGETIAHVAGCKYGLGTYPIRYDDAVSALATLRAALATTKETP